jgi:hypothetical protein
MDYSGANDLKAKNRGIYAYLTFREALDKDEGYTKRTNKIFEFIDIIDIGLFPGFQSG